MCVTSDVSRIKKIDKNVSEWAGRSVHQSLIYLGDLCRYKLDIYPNWSPSLAIRYYSQAIYFKPEYGMPHNQLGTLATHLNSNHSLDAVYHYLHCLSSKIAFEGTENNLHRLFEKNSIYLQTLPEENSDADCIVLPEPHEHIKRFISRFLLLVDVWYFTKKIPDVYSLCHQTSVDLRECLSYPKPGSSVSGDGNVDTESSDADSITSPTFLHSDIIFKITIICIFCLSKLQSSQSHHISNVIAFTLALYSQILQHICNRFQEAILNFPIPPEVPEINGITKKKKKLKMRRRRKVHSGSESEASDAEAVNDESSSDESFISQDEHSGSSSSDEEENGVKITDKVKEKQSKENGEVEVNGTGDRTPEISEEKIIQLSKRMDPNDMLEIIAEEPLLRSIKIINDWLSQDVEVLKSCGKSTRSLFKQIIFLVNLLNVKTSNKIQGLKSNIDHIQKNFKNIPLPEDVTVKGLEFFAEKHRDIYWSSTSGYFKSIKEESLVRSFKLVSFGHFLTTIGESGVSYDAKRDVFSVEIVEKVVAEVNGFNDDTVSLISLL